MKSSFLSLRSLHSHTARRTIAPSLFFAAKEHRDRKERWDRRHHCYGLESYLGFVARVGLPEICRHGVVVQIRGREMQADEGWREEMSKTADF